MWQGKRRLIKTVDDWAGVDFNDIIIDEILLPITFVEELYKIDKNISNETSVSK